MKMEFSIIDALAEHGWVPVFAKWRGSQGHYWCATTKVGNVYSEMVQTAVAQAVKAAWDKAASDQANLADAQAAESFYRDYVQDNPVFETMPHKCWDYVKEHAQDVMKRPYLEHGNEWEGVERAVRSILRENGMDGDSW